VSPRWKKILKWSGIVLLVLLLIPVTFFLLVYNGAFGKVYTGEELRKIQNYVASEVYSADNRLLGSYFIENRSDLTSKHLPPFILGALIATEDARFYEHNGVDTRGLLRVFFKTLLLREKNAGGGSTIAQQLAKNLLKRQDHGMFTMPVNKIKEAIHAVRFHKVYSQQEILALYLNTVSVGEDTYGFQSASRRFFSTTCDSLKIEEAAMLVGMLKSPTRFNPRTHPDLAFGRRNVVIDNMALRKYLTPEVADSLKKLPLTLKYNRAGSAGTLAPHFVAQLESTINKLLDGIKDKDGNKYNLYTDGLKIYTTLDAEMQTCALKAVHKHMKQLQTELDKLQGKTDPWGARSTLISGLTRNSSRYKSLQAEGMKESDIEQAMQVRHETELFDWEGGHTTYCSPVDSIRYCQRLLQTGFLAMDPWSGEVKVWIGGDDFAYFEYDHIRSKRQVGSTFKPIVYAAALEQGVSPCDYVKNEQKIYDQFSNWSPANADGKYGGKYSLKGALAQSVNVVSVEVLLKAGLDNVLQTAKHLGIESEIPHVPAIALGVADISLYEMVRAYCAFANGGIIKDAVFITRIEDRNGKQIYLHPAAGKGKTALSPQTAYYMSQMLCGVVNEGTASSLRSKYHFKDVMAGKTGTTQNQADGWFIGFTPGLVAGAWVGAESPSVHFNSILYGQGAHMALPEWALFMQGCKSNKRLKKYLKGSFPKGPELEAMPACESYIPDNALKKAFRKLFGRRVKHDKTQ
jgi:penicillin-binding protein 1A